MIATVALNGLGIHTRNNNNCDNFFYFKFAPASDICIDRFQFIEFQRSVDSTTCSSKIRSPHPQIKRALAFNLHLITWRQ